MHEPQDVQDDETRRTAEPSPNDRLPPLERLRRLAQPADDPGDRPWVTVAFAQTLDGRIATRTGDSQWISCADSLTFSHCLRASHDAILVGIGTVLADNPRLTTRLVPGPSPRRVVVDSRLRLPLDAAVLADGAAGGTTVVTTELAQPEPIAALQALGTELLFARADDDGHVDLRDALRQLRLRGQRSLLIEGGARMITAALRARAVDRLAICVAPKLIGAGIEGVGDLAISRLADALPLRNATFLQLADDMLVVGDLS